MYFTLIVHCVHFQQYGISQCAESSISFLHQKRDIVPKNYFMHQKIKGTSGPETIFYSPQLRFVPEKDVSPGNYFKCSSTEIQMSPFILSALHNWKEVRDICCRLITDRQSGKVESSYLIDLRRKHLSVQTP